MGLLTSQGQQPPVVIDTSWLLVGHADETTHVVRADNSRGWTLMVADPRLALSATRSAQATGAGAARFTGRLTTSIDEVLADGQLLADNEEAARHIDDQVAVLLAETVWGRRAGPGPGPVHEGARLVRGGDPGHPERPVSGRETFAAPDPHAPVVGGQDIFKAATPNAT